MSKKWMYLFKDPMGSNDIKIGITKNPRMRLGVYQCSYSAKSHRACFDYVWEGPGKQIEKLERALKEKYKWEIESDNLGESEWITDVVMDELIKVINEEITGWRFHIAPLQYEFPIRQADVDYSIGNEEWRQHDQDN